MTRFRLGLIVLTVLMTVTFLTVAFVVRRPGGSANQSIPEPVSYAKPTADGGHVLVVFGDPAAEAKLKDAATRQYAARVRQTYFFPVRLVLPWPSLGRSSQTVRVKCPIPGLYRAGKLPVLVNPIPGYAPDDQVYLTADGRHVVRIEGDWWKTRAYPAGKRLPAEVEQAQLDAPAVRCFTAGKLTHEYRLRELVTNPDKLPHSPDHILWPAGAVLNADAGRFHLFTQDSNRITIDVANGEIVERTKTGIGNPLARWLLTVTVALTVALAGALVWYTFLKRRAEQAVEAKV